MNIKEAATKVLKENGGPLNATEITKLIIEAGFWKSEGKTPEATVSAQIYADIQKKGDKSLFVKVAPGIFALKSTGGNEPSTTPIPEIPVKNPKHQPANECFSFTKCAEKVLKEFGGKKPMHYKEITKEALAKGWLVTEGKTPDATMYAQVITEINRQQKRGEQPRFVQHGRGYLGLSQWMGSGLAFQIDEHNNQVRKALHAKLLTMKPGEFEELISQLLVKMGFEMVEVTKLSGDGGIDVRGTLVLGEIVHIKMAVQVKRWKSKNNIQAPEVRHLRGSLKGGEQGFFITSSNFSSGAIEEATRPDAAPILLMNGEQLVMLLMEHGFGVKRSTLNLFEIDEDALLTGEGK